MKGHDHGSSGPVPSAAAWEFLVTYQPAIINICRKRCRGRPELIDELLSEAAVRVPIIHDMWDDTVGVKLTTYVFTSLQWYLWKHMNKCKKIELPQCSDEEKDELAQVKCRLSDTQIGYDLEVKDQVQLVLGQLDEYDRWILDAYYMCGWTFEEVGDALGITKITASKHVARAMRRAREIIGHA